MASKADRKVAGEKYEEARQASKKAFKLLHEAIDLACRDLDPAWDEFITRLKERCYHSHHEFNATGGLLTSLIQADIYHEPKED